MPTPPPSFPPGVTVTGILYLPRLPPQIMHPTIKLLTSDLHLLPSPSQSSSTPVVSAGPSFGTTTLSVLVMPPSSLKFSIGSPVTGSFSLPHLHPNTKHPTIKSPTSDSHLLPSTPQSFPPPVASANPNIGTTTSSDLAMSLLPPSFSTGATCHSKFFPLPPHHTPDYQITHI